MKTIREVCELTGVTRRTLQEYDKIDLLKPTTKTLGGYWLYDDESIEILMFIRVFVEANYKRKDIKRILDSSDEEKIKSFDKLIESLKEKRAQLDGMIKLVKAIRLTTTLPENTIQDLARIDVSNACKEKGFKSYFKETVDQLAELDDEDEKETELFLLLWYRIIALGGFLGVPEDDGKVQRAMKEIYDATIRLFSDGEENDEELSAEEFLEFIEELLAFDSDLYQAIELQCGEGAADYIVRVAKVYCNKNNH